jgi:hypothetical protein
MLQTLKGGADIEAVMQDVLYKTPAQIELQLNGVQAVADLKKLLVCRGGFTSAAADALLSTASYYCFYQLNDFVDLHFWYMTRSQELP